MRGLTVQAVQGINNPVIIEIVKKDDSASIIKEPKSENNLNAKKIEIENKYITHKEMMEL